ncbi:hypothetical protein SGB_04011 [Shigella boydii ATCC 9905]|nr:hypothetical protein SGB_04011 [Shigella boydii ATCC 9905]RIF76145.1 hypothetical protein UL57_00250 [Shigella boydii]
MLLNRVRCEAMEKIRVYFDRNLCRFLPPKESIFLICDTLLSFHNKTQQQIYVFFNIIVAGDFFQAIICAFGT